MRTIKQYRMVIMAKKNRNIETMTDEEFEKLLDEVAGERAEIQEPIIDPRFTERSDNPTPSGGDYSIAYYYDEDGFPCEKSKADFMNIVEYKKGGIRVNEHYGVIGRNGKKD